MARIKYIDISLLFTALLCNFSIGSLNGQQEKSYKIDSLLQIIESKPSENNAANNINLASLHIAVDSSLAIQYAKEGIKLAKNKNDKYHQGKGNFILGGMHLDYNKPIQAEAYYRKADSILSQLIKVDSSYENLRLWVRTNFNIGVALSYQGAGKDIEILEKISPIANKIEAYDILAKSNTNLAIQFYNASQYDKAYKYFLISGPQHKKNKDYQTFVEDRLIFSSCLIEMDSLNKAESVLKEVAPILPQINDKTKEQLYYTALGEYYYKRKEYQKSLTELKKALALLKQNSIIRHNLQLYMDFMQTYGGMEDYENAILYAELGIEATMKNKNKILQAEINKELSYYKYQIGKEKEAYEHLLIYVSISDSFNLKELEREVNRLETKFQTEKKEREILELKNLNDNVDLQLAKKKSQNYLLLLTSLGLLFTTGIVYLGYRNFKKKDELKAIEINQLKYEQEAKVINAMLEGQENERNRIAIDLHDGLAGRLSASRMHMEKLLKNTDLKNKSDLTDIANNLDNSLSELRNIARNLMPETLFKYGLKNAVEDYCASISQGRTDIRFVLLFYDAETTLSKNRILTIYRIIQELINNAVKHAQASEVLVQYMVDKQKINITVEDNGIGFSNSPLKSDGGMGLINLKTRVAYLNGEIEFDSIPNEGTTVHIVINI